MAYAFAGFDCGYLTLETGNSSVIGSVFDDQLFHVIAVGYRDIGFASFISFEEDRVLSSFELAVLDAAVEHDFGECLEFCHLADRSFDFDVVGVTCSDGIGRAAVSVGNEFAESFASISG